MKLRLHIYDKDFVYMTAVVVSQAGNTLAHRRAERNFVESRLVVTTTPNTDGATLQLQPNRWT